MAKGIRRIKDGWGDQDSVLVRYPRGAEMEMPSSQYVAQGHHPPITALPVQPPPFQSEQSPRRATLELTSPKPT